MATTVDELMQLHPWRAIPGCPGRHVLRGGPTVQGPASLVGSGVELSTHRTPGAAAEVVVARLPDGGLISYRNPDGRYVHTLNTPQGLARKLAQLGIAVEDLLPTAGQPETGPAT